MGGIRERIHCRRCGYDNARIQIRYSSNKQIIFCIRCGYSSEHFFNKEKYESLKVKTIETDGEQWELSERCWEWEVIYPTGSYICRRKGEDWFAVDSIEDGTIEKLLEHLDEYDVCKHTFYKVRSWHIKDLHSNTTTLFSMDEYYGYSVEDDRCKDEEDKRRTGLTMWGKL